MPSHRAILAVVAAAVALGVAALAVVVLVRDDDAIQANGDLIAFSCKEPKNTWYAICIANSDGTDRRRITKQMETSNPAWSPNGQQIAFTRNEEVGEYLTYTEDDVFVMDADGDNVRQLTPERDGRHALRPGWSPDGREIAFVLGKSVPSGYPRFGDLFVIDVKSRDLRRLTKGGRATTPDWSPDGREIVFTRAEGISTNHANMDLYVVDAAGGEPRRLTRTPRLYETTPAWSPDGSRIAFTRWTNLGPSDGKSVVYIINRDGSGERLILAKRYFGHYPFNLAWSPDGRTLAFETSPNPFCTAISLIDVDTSAVRPLTSCERQRESTLSPDWQPNPGTAER